MEVTFVVLWKTKKDISFAWMDIEILGIASTFAYEGGLDRALGDMGPSSD